MNCHGQGTGSIKFVFPVDGDMLNEYDGEVKEGQLWVDVQVEAPADWIMQVNGVTASSVGSAHTATIALDGYRNTITIEDESGSCKESIVVYWLKNATSKYRLSLDDNIWFLQDIAENQDRYKSIFDNPFLGFLKAVHDEYGTKIHANVYYQTDGFNLSQMPDKYKDEWRANAYWLRLTFHAWQNDPDKPYQHAGAEQILRDCERVTEQIVRFAGEEVTGPVTTIHWGEATREGCRALKKFGFHGLMGYFEFANDEPRVSYYLNRQQIEHLNKRDFWKDHSEDIIFIKNDLVLDRVKQDEIVPALNHLLERPHERGYLELMIHEQYYYPHYAAYQPDYKEKIISAVKWATEHGYQPAFISECIFESSSA